jgi:hypothetical protein
VTRGRWWIWRAWASLKERAGIVDFYTGFVSPCKRLSALLSICVFFLLAGNSLAATPYKPAYLKSAGGKAIAPKGAPTYVKKMIRAGNEIRDKKYKWGGGHAGWDDRGYDCSGAVSYVLYKAGLLDYSLTSGGFMKWGKKKKSDWVTIYASKGHVFMVIAGLRWDTSYITDGDKSGPGWSEYMRPTKGFRVRHPAGSRKW